jgi:hypothetical protein
MALALDGNATGSVSDSAATSVGAALTTTVADLLIACVYTNDPSFAAFRTVTGISGAGTTGWTQHAAITGNTSTFKKTNLEVWWGTAAAALSGVTITATYSGGAVATIILAAFSGANTAAPFDTNGSIPATSSDLDGTASAPTTTISTNNANDALISVIGTTEAGPTFGDFQSGFSSMGTVDGFGAPSFEAVGSEAEYRIVSATQSSAAVGFTGNHNNYLQITTAIREAAAADALMGQACFCDPHDERIRSYPRDRDLVGWRRRAGSRLLTRPSIVRGKPWRGVRSAA